MELQNIQSSIGKMIWCYEARNLDERQLLANINTRVPIIVTDLNNRIIGLNHEWVVMCKYTAEEAFGETPQILQGELTDLVTARDFSMQVRGGHPGFVALINYKKDGTAFVNHIYGWALGDLLIAETYTEHAPNSLL